MALSPARLAFLGEELGIRKARANHKEGIAAGHQLIARPGSEEPDRARHKRQIVGKGDTTIDTISSPKPSVFGQSVTITGTVSHLGPGNPTGTITFYNAATNLGTVAMTSGVASLGGPARR